ncbi:GL22721 [Drosophila persimilis]|uniref:GL22721 n=1 Tax=Drosophila persimilis TaxID=7234 RepID=B4GZU7_DROPE|nr:GL22721 [Drosophila persimilis]
MVVWLGLCLLLIVLSLYLLYAFERQTRIDRLTHNWPAPPSLPILGHLHILAKLVGPHPFRRATELVNTHLKDHRGKLWLGTKLYLVDCNPKDIQALCSAQQMLQKTTDYKVFENWLCEGLFTADYDKWFQRRKTLTPAFNYTMIKQFVQVFERQSRILLPRVAEYAESGKSVDFLDLISCYTLDVICETALGVSVDAQSSRDRPTLKRFVMYNMTLHTDHQQQCREEIWQICGKDTKEPITIEQVQQLEFLEWCVKETLRMYPPAPLLTRRATANCQINDFFIPKGNDVVISPMYMGRCKDFFPEPLVFKPERWARGAEPKIEATTFIPFMTGARSCLGQRYAMVMIKSVMAHLLRSYRFEPIGERQVKMKLNFVVTLHTVEPYYCRVRAIE